MRGERGLVVGISCDHGTQTWQLVCVTLKKRFRNDDMAMDERLPIRPAKSDRTHRRRWRDLAHVIFGAVSGRDWKRKGTYRKIGSSWQMQRIEPRHITLVTCAI